MNIAIIHPTDDLPPRRAFSTEDIHRMIEAGVLREDEKLELIDGELVMMAAKGIAHERLKNALLRAIVLAAPDELIVAAETTFQLTENILVEPDLALISRKVLQGSTNDFAKPNSQDVLLVIEVAASSIIYDRNIKSALYARHGIREFWLIDANERIAWIHTGPSADGWSSIVERGPGETLGTPALPNLAIRLADLA